jgi:hypothetical protein
MAGTPMAGTASAGTGTGKPDARPARWRRRGRIARHEWMVAAVLAVALAAVMTWPALAHPTTSLPVDWGDPTLVAWGMAWDGHALLTNPLHLWDANAFYPERYSLAFSDSLLGYAPAGIIGRGLAAALLRYNLMFVLAFALASFGAYALARQLGALRIGAAIAGVAFAYAPWRAGQITHLHVLSSGGIVLALAMLARGHGWSFRSGRSGPLRPGWVWAGWAVAAWQVTLGFGIGLAFVYVMLAGFVVASGRYGYACFRSRRVRPANPRLFWANLGGAAVFGAVTVLMSLPYVQVAHLHPDNARTIGYIALFSPHLTDLGVAPKGSWLWGSLGAGARASMRFPDESSLMPGLAVSVLAVVGLVFSAWRPRWRIALAAGAIAAAALALGPNLPGGGNPGYVTLFHVLPGWDSMRTPGRLVLWVSLPLGLLAAGAVTAALTRLRPAPATARRAWPRRAAGPVVALLVLAFVAVEGVTTTPYGKLPQFSLPSGSVAEPMLILPLKTYLDNLALVSTTDAFPRMPNGASGIVPHSQDLIVSATRNFPDAASVAYLRRMGIRTVVVLAGEPDLSGHVIDVGKPIDGLGITRTVVNIPATAYIYHLS